MRKILCTAGLSLILAIGGTSLASADPAFGPGNNGGGEGNSSPTAPSDPKCHPPGQTVDVPGCK